MNRPYVLVTTPQHHNYLYELGADVVVVGRASDCRIGLDDPNVSRHHAEIRFNADDGIAMVRDLESTNGTQLNGVEVTETSVEFGPGDTLWIGGHILRFYPSDQLPQTDLALPKEQSQKHPAELETQILSGAQRLGGESATTIINDSNEALFGLDEPLFPVVITNPSCRISVAEGERMSSITLEARNYHIGRHVDNDVVLEDPKASSRHAILEWRDGQFFAQDLGSTNGCRVNGVAIYKSTRLRDGDVLRVGEVRIHFSGAEPTSKQRAPQRRRPTVLIPGFAGSELWYGETRVWPNLKRLLRAKEDAIVMEWTAQLQVGQLVREPVILPGLARSDSFSWLIRYLRDDLGYGEAVDLLEFPYDWRADLVTTAKDLVERVEQWRASRPDPTEKVTVIAHSMGGLVARLACQEPTFQDALERMVLLGTPHSGAGVVLSLALEGGSLLPLGLGAKKVRRLALALPSFYQLLPEYPVAQFDDGSVFLPLTTENWLVQGSEQYLKRAQQVRAMLRGQNVGVPVTSIFGYDQDTIERIQVTRENDRIVQGEIKRTKCGDGFVAERSAVFPNSEIHPVNQHHGVLFSDPDVLRRLRYELLERP